MEKHLVKNNVLNSDYLNEHLLFWELCFGQKDKCTADWYRWLNENSPNGYNNSYTIKNENNESICSYGLLPYPSKINGVQHLSSICINGMTNPEYSGQGLFSNIIAQSTKLLQEDRPQTFYSFPLGTNTGSIKAHLKAGFTELPDLYFYEKTKQTIKPQPEIDYNIIEKFNIYHDSDIKKFHEKYSFSFLKDYKHLNWRYTSHPIYSYKIIELIVEKQFKGYAVVKIFGEDVKKLHIVDYAYSTSTDLDLLLHSIENVAFELKVDLINLWSLEDSFETKHLITKEFTQTKQHNKFLILPGETFNKVDIKKSHIVLGDNDVF
jgi:RimJ/RimL family protein N-acetyltransferase